MCYLLRPITHSFLNLYNFFRSYSATFNNIVISICGRWIGQWMGRFWKHFCLVFGFLQLQWTGPRFWTLRVIKIFLPRFWIQGEILLVDLVNNSWQISSFAYPYSPTLLYLQLLFGFQLQVLPQINHYHPHRDPPWSNRSYKEHHQESAFWGEHGYCRLSAVYDLNKIKGKVIWVFIDLVVNSLNLCILGKLYEDHALWGPNSQILATVAQSFPELTRAFPNP